ncbi:MAG: AmpG family muropeptide MFS transporter [Gammaproteobacteria bacterium]|jgi:PAT family beta-lactamase induction signal transducer AmpG|nr:AmpG family muropeptide MFS transporter [Gammaproteobacteria bacterium]
MPLADQRRSWREILINRRMLTCLFLGFTSGLPLYVLIQLIPAWLRTEGVDLATIGLFSLIALPYTWKFAWSPLLDRFALPWLGRRRGWMLLTQIILLASIAALGTFHPAQSLQMIIYVVIAITVSSASQDIAIDAYRRELLADDELGTGNAIHVNAYRIASLIPGSLALILADHIAWQQVFWITGAFMLVGIGMTLMIREVSDDAIAPHSLRAAIVEPFQEFLGRNGWQRAGLVLLFMLLYKLGDNMAVALETPFFIDQGFSLTEIGSVKKLSALWASVLGSVVGGVVMLRLSINRALWLFGVVQIISILGYAALAVSGDSLLMLFVAVSFEYFGVGLGTVGLTAFIAQQTSLKFAATQFALLSSLTAVPRTLANASTGFIIEAMGYFHFYLLCFALALPGMMLLLWVAPWRGRTSSS